MLNAGKTKGAMETKGKKTGTVFLIRPANKDAFYSNQTAPKNTAEQRQKNTTIALDREMTSPSVHFLTCPSAGGSR